MCMEFNAADYSEEIMDANYDGCVKECRENEVLVVDPRRGDWNCVPLVVNATILNGICPGKFNTGRLVFLFYIELVKSRLLLVSSILFALNEDM